MEYGILLDVLNLWVLVVCLYIIGDTIKHIQLRVSNKSTGAVLYLREKAIMKGIKILMVVVIIWSIRETLSFADIFFDFDLNWVCSILGILIALLLSYGLYILAVTFKCGFGLPEEKDNSL